MLENEWQILFFVDGNVELQGKEVYGKKIYPPDKLAEYQDIPVYLASTVPESRKQMSKTCHLYGIHNIFAINFSTEMWVGQQIIDALNERVIDLGLLLKKVNNKTSLKELTFISGGSGVLDYAFLKNVSVGLNLKNYLEIGTYIGESINVMSDVCDVCISITAPLDAPYSMKSWCKLHNMPDFSDRLASASNIVHFYENSQTFDYHKIKWDIDLYFIDGDHSYEGVKSDTLNVFAHRKSDSIVIWHDFKSKSDYMREVVKAVYDALGEKDFQNVYVTDNNLCGIYIPEQYKPFFPLKTVSYTEEGQDLWAYNAVLDIVKK